MFTIVKDKPVCLSVEPTCLYQKNTTYDNTMQRNTRTNIRIWTKSESSRRLEEMKKRLVSQQIMFTKAKS